jgi:hypothetical protein
VLCHESKKANMKIKGFKSRTYPGEYGSRIISI